MFLLGLVIFWFGSEIVAWIACSHAIAQLWEWWIIGQIPTAPAWGWRVWFGVVGILGLLRHSYNLDAAEMQQVRQEKRKKRGLVVTELDPSEIALLGVRSAWVRALIFCPAALAVGWLTKTYLLGG